MGTKINNKLIDLTSLLADCQDETTREGLVQFFNECGELANQYTNTPAETQASLFTKTLDVLNAASTNPDRVNKALLGTRSKVATALFMACKSPSFRHMLTSLIQRWLNENQTDLNIQLNFFRHNKAIIYDENFPRDNKFYFEKEDKLKSASSDMSSGAMPFFPMGWNVGEESDAPISMSSITSGQKSLVNPMPPPYGAMAKTRVYPKPYSTSYPAPAYQPSASKASWSDETFNFTPNAEQMEVEPIAATTTARLVKKEFLSEDDIAEMHSRHLPDHLNTAMNTVAIKHNWISDMVDDKKNTLASVDHRFRNSFPVITGSKLTVNQIKESDNLNEFVNAYRFYCMDANDKLTKFFYILLRALQWFDCYQNVTDEDLLNYCPLMYLERCSLRVPQRSGCYAVQRGSTTRIDLKNVLGAMGLKNQFIPTERLGPSTRYRTPFEGVMKRCDKDADYTNIDCCKVNQEGATDWSKENFCEDQDIPSETMQWILDSFLLKIKERPRNSSMEGIHAAKVNMLTLKKAGGILNDYKNKLPETM